MLSLLHWSEDSVIGSITDLSPLDTLFSSSVSLITELVSNTPSVVVVVVVFSVVVFTVVVVVVVVVVVSSGTVIGILCGGGVSSISKPSRPGRNESAERVVSQGGRGLGVVDVVVLVVSEKLRCQPKLFRFRGSDERMHRMAGCCQNFYCKDHLKLEKLNWLKVFI